MNTMTYIAFDTLEYANTLKKAGLDPKIAEVHAELQAKILNEAVQTRLATKEDIAALKLATKEDINALKLSTKEDIDALKSSTKEDIDTLRLSTKADIDSVKEDVAVLKKDITNLRFELLTKLGGTIIGCCTVLGILITVFSLA